MSQSALEGTFGYVRGLVRGAGGLSAFSFRRGLAALVLLHENQILSRPGGPGHDLPLGHPLRLNRVRRGRGAEYSAQEHADLAGLFEKLDV